jgi:hypothetical protein
LFIRSQNKIKNKPNKIVKLQTLLQSPFMAQKKQKRKTKEKNKRAKRAKSKTKELKP